MKKGAAIRLGLLAFFLLSCSRLTNGLSQVFLDCGTDATGGRYIQVLDPEGQTVLGTDIRVRPANGERAIALASSRGCVRYDGTSDLIVSSTLPNRSWGVVLNASAIDWRDRVQMRDIAREDLHWDCPADPFTRGEIRSALRVNEALNAAFPFQIQLRQEEKAMALTSFALGQDVINLPADLQNADFALDLHYQNLFQDDLALQAGVKSCTYTLDREKPRVRSNRNPSGDGGLLKIFPGEDITFEIEDQNPASLHYCLRPHADETACEDPANFQLGSRVQAPSQGKWCLESFADDRAGNRSDPFQVCFIAWQGSVIDQIATLGESALRETPNDQLSGSIRLLRALNLYIALATLEEKAEAAMRLFQSVLEAAAQIFERQRQSLPGMVYAMHPIEDSWLLVDEQGLKLLDAEGRIIDSLPMTGKAYLRASIQGTRILAANLEGFVHLEKQGARLRILQEENWPEEFYFSQFAWNPRFDEFFAVEDDQGYRGIVYRRSAGRYESVQEVENVTGQDLYWSPDGQSLLVTDYERMEVYQRGESYEQEWIDGDARRIQGAAWIADDAFVFARADGDLFAWSRADGLEKIARPKVDAREPEALLPAVLGRDGRSAFVLRQGKISLLTRAESAFSEEAIASVSPTDLFQWSYAGGHLMLAGANSVQVLSAWPEQKNEYLRRQVLGTGTERILLAAHRPGRTLTFGGVYHLRSWEDQSIFGSFALSNERYARVKWVDDRIAVAATDSTVSHWTQDGRLQARSVHGTKHRQVNDMVWTDARDRYLSVGEDGELHLWSAAGQNLAVLNDAAQAPSEFMGNWRGTALFSADARSLVSGGIRYWNFWTQNPAGDYQFHKVVFSKSLDRETRAVPGDLQRVSWQGEDHIYAARNYGPDGSIRFFRFDGSDSPIWPLGEVASLRTAISADGQFLSRVDPKTYQVQEYRLGPSGYETWGEPLPLPRAAVGLKYSADGRGLIAICVGHQPFIWSLENGKRLLQTHSFPIARNGNYDVSWDGQDFAYVENNRVILGRAPAQLFAQFKVFSAEKRLDHAVLRNKVLAAAASAANPADDGKDTRTEVRLLPLDLDGMRARICAAVSDFLQYSNDFDFDPGIAASDRELCL